MQQDELETILLMKTIKNIYFKDIKVPIEFFLQKNLEGKDAIFGRTLYFGSGNHEIHITYNNRKIIDNKHRNGLIPIVAHLLSQTINPVDPDGLMAERLPEKIVQIWQEMKESGSVEINCKFMED